MLNRTRQAVATPSLIDRLLDDAPHNQVEAAGASLADLRLFKQSVARDLEALLNTRIADFDEALEPYPQTRKSLLSFGIMDISAVNLQDPDDRALLRDKVRQAIELHEPRLSKVRVALDAPKELDRQLRFRVDAVLRFHPNRPPVSFDATLQLSSQAYRVKDQL